MTDIITPFQTYLILQADTFRTTLFGTGPGHPGLQVLIYIVSFIGLIVSVLFGVVNIDNMLTNRSRILACLGGAVCIFMVSMTILMDALVPTTKTLAGSFIIPAVVNNAEVRKTVDEMAKSGALSAEWLKETLSREVDKMKAEAGIPPKKKTKLVEVEVEG